MTKFSSTESPLYALVRRYLMICSFIKQNYFHTENHCMVYQIMLSGTGIKMYMFYTWTMGLN